MNKWVPDWRRLRVAALGLMTVGAATHRVDQQFHSRRN